MRTMDQNLQRELIMAVATSVIANAEELTSLDQAIGDGDHGINMKRGFEAVLTDIDGLATRPLPDALHAIGMALLMKIGGASGPLYGTLFMTLGKELPASPSTEEVARALRSPVSRTASQIIGLREIAELPRDEAVAAIVLRTRRYAAYQRKWLRRIPGIQAISADRQTLETAAEILTRVQGP